MDNLQVMEDMAAVVMADTNQECLDNPCLGCQDNLGRCNLYRLKICVLS